MIKWLKKLFSKYEPKFKAGDFIRESGTERWEAENNIKYKVLQLGVNNYLIESPAGVRHTLSYLHVDSYYEKVT